MLDDLFLVRAVNDGFGNQPLELFSPQSTVLMRGRGGGADNFEASNPDPGVPFYYYLGEESESPLSIEIFDDEGNLVRSYSSQESDFERCLLLNMDPRSPFEPEYPAAETGLNKWNWNGRRQNFNCVDDITFYSGYAGPSAPPGEYRARISHDGETREKGFTLVADPRMASSPESLEHWVARVDETAQLLEAVLLGLEQLRKAERQINTLMEDNPDNTELQAAGKSALEAIEAWDHAIIQPLHETGEDEDAWETRFAGQVAFLLGTIDRSGAPVTAGALVRLADLKSQWSGLESQWDDIRVNHIESINSLARKNGIPYVSSD